MSDGKGEVQGWAPRDKTLSVYVSERTEAIIEELKDSIPLRSKAEVGRQAIEGGGLRSLPGYAAACRKVDKAFAERDAADSRAVVA
jgi:hypothetical protein